METGMVFSKRDPSVYACLVPAKLTGVEISTMGATLTGSCSRCWP